MGGPASAGPLFFVRATPPGTPESARGRGADRVCVLPLDQRAEVEERGRSSERPAGWRETSPPALRWPAIALLPPHVAQGPQRHAEWPVGAWKLRWGGLVQGSALIDGSSPSDAISAGLCADSTMPSGCGSGRPSCGTMPPLRGAAGLRRSCRRDALRGWFAARSCPARCQGETGRGKLVQPRPVGTGWTGNAPAPPCCAFRHGAEGMPAACGNSLGEAPRRPGNAHEKRAGIAPRPSSLAIDRLELSPARS